ncbi:2-amino-4-hydroxy-6-hydroxymethyldihydropteridine diphosphokinase [Schumannella luteola]|jgi:2-amino-4-hydroxy-6-hydroxymethyldihydropteridine diphosphokinase|uniref:2-amino-4-hydroxy-6-hydroxymethyldihydropteridine diphosphokinase n=1 Tax=Schumannella luteola TaxID=472059 RepID=A0A852YEB5_9MICO|nr:2-amino-4-hydroxy-6-hydroxymethyldihydropteridine diphosphokinase [Schumannella luteola]NYG97458.1 2-amino-4-hydroxy-6-hydroxymethyldihydropteridine diphosphokinase [Schumannella luteola]TPX05876.1 2-amino-4-hydroxy-6-hydroxymethyldihydropteridine diphosphokinase [Schumannella luteola]
MTDVPRTAVIALGANLGERETTIRQAVAELEATEQIDVLAVSPLYDSVALTLQGRDESKPGYLNGVALVTTTLDPETLLAVLQGIETAHGRERVERWGDRTLDLDIVDFAGMTRDSDLLTLPHPRAVERDFVLRPWLDVDPDAQLVGEGRVADLLARLDRSR